MGLEKKTFSVKVDDGGYVLDSRYFPMIIVKWVGTLTPALVDRYVDHRSPFLAEGDKIGTKIIVITDISQMNVPGATARKYIADRATEVDSKSKSMHEYIMVIPNAVMRGVVTAVNWIMSEKGVPTRNANSYETAFAMAIKSYETLGIPVTRPDGGYKLPDP